MAVNVYALQRKRGNFRCCLLCNIISGWQRDQPNSNRQTVFFIHIYFCFPFYCVGRHTLAVIHSAAGAVPHNAIENTKEFSGQFAKIQWHAHLIECHGTPKNSLPPPWNNLPQFEHINRNWILCDNNNEKHSFHLLIGGHFSLKECAAFFL